MNGSLLGTYVSFISFPLASNGVNLQLDLKLSEHEFQVNTDDIDTDPAEGDGQATVWNSLL